MSNPTQNITPTLATFDPCDHLIVLKTFDGPKAHYPFSWRLHEFRLRYPQGLIQAEILHLDIERDLVIVRVTACADGLEAGKGVGLHTGSLTLLDQVTERAKAQALMDLGVGCGWPVLFDCDLETAEIMSQQQQYEQSSSKHDERQEASHGHQPARTASTVQALFAKAYRVKATELEARWQRYKAHLLGAAIADDQLTDDHLSTLNATASPQYQKLVVERELVASGSSKNGSKPSRESEAR